LALRIATGTALFGRFRLPDVPRLIIPAVFTLSHAVQMSQGVSVAEAFVAASRGMNPVPGSGRSPAFYPTFYRDSFPLREEKKKGEKKRRSNSMQIPRRYFRFRFFERRALCDVICALYAPWTAVDELKSRAEWRQVAIKQIENERGKYGSTLGVLRRPQRTNVTHMQILREKRERKREREREREREIDPVSREGLASRGE